MPALSKALTETASCAIATVNGMPCTCASEAAYWFFASSLIAKIPACDWPMRSRSRKSGVEARGVVDARLRQRLGGAARLLARRLDHAHADPLREQHARDRRADAPGAVDHDVAHRAALGPEQRAPALTARGDPITTIRSPVADDVVAAGEDRLVAADDRGDLRVLGICASRSGTAEDLRGGVLVDVELADLHLAVGEHVRLAGGRDADDAADRVRGLELRGDDEVDVELALAPELDVLDARRADHRRRARRPRGGRTCRRRGSPRHATCTR